MLQYDVGYSWGSAWRGDSPADANSPGFDDCPGVVVTLVPMNERRENTLDPVESHARMITVHPAVSAVTAVASLLAGARVGVVRSEAQIVEYATVRGPAVPLPRATLHGVLPDGVVACFRILDRAVVPGRAIRRLEIQMQCREGRRNEGKDGPPAGISLEVSLVATGEPKEALLPDADGMAAGSREQGRPVSAASGMPTTETIMLAPQTLQQQDRLAVILPSPFEVEGIATFVALIEMKTPPKEGTDEAVEHAGLLRACRDCLDAASGGRDEQGGSAFDAGKRGIEDAMRLVQSPTHGRQALMYLAREAKAPLVEDVTLSAPDTVVDRLAHAVANECGSGPAIEADALGWRLQKTAYRLIVELLSAEQAWPGLEAIMIRHTGEPGRHPSVLKELVSDASGIADLEQRLLLENFIYLEDISPAARTRAFEWLAARGRAPEGYDPLAPLKARRSALNRILQEQQ